MTAVDVLVIGGGNAALCAAIAARRAGASVLLVERAPRAWRGGNSKYTRNIRCVHGDDAVMPGTYSEEELAEDLASVTGDGSDPELTALAISRSREAPAWMEQNGVGWQAALNGTLQLARTNRFFLGGGKALVNTYFATAEQLGVEIAYDTEAIGFQFDDAKCTSVTVSSEQGPAVITPRCVVAASGGFEANREWLREYWGDGVDNYAIRGARQNDGLVLRRLLDCGAQARGNPRGFHAVAVDLRGPKFEGGIVTRVDSVPFSVVLNRDGQRFYDEGEDLWPKRYAAWGQIIAEQPGQVAYSLFDSQVMGRFMTTAFKPYKANSLADLCAIVGLPVEASLKTLSDYNSAVQPGEYDTTRLDAARTAGLRPPKTHWALPIDTPPFYAYPLCPGVTFTYLGVAVDRTARVVRDNGSPFHNVFAAGEIMAGNILLRGYLAGFGLTIGTVFGRLAGEEAAVHARA